MKRNVQAYCFARPYLRISFKVIKGKTEKFDWIFAPKCPAGASPYVTLPDTAIKIVGPKISEHCRQVSIEVHNNGFSHLTELPMVLPKDSKSTISPTALFSLHAIVQNVSSIQTSPSVTAPLQFISVDGRPLSSVRGTPKEMIRKFKKAFKARSKEQNIKSISDPFLCLNILCQPCSYDANIEPAKDDVLFHESDKLLEAADHFFGQIYGVHEDVAPTQATQQKASGHFDLLLSDRACNSPSTPASPLRNGSREVDLRMSSENENNVSNLPRTSPVRELYANNAAKRTNGTHSMFDDGWDDESESYNATGDIMTSLTDGDEDVGEQLRGDITVSNPFTIAKLNAAMRHSSSHFTHTTQSKTPSRVQSHNENQIMHSPHTVSPITPNTPYQRRQTQPVKAGKRPESPTFFPFPEQRREKAVTAHSMAQIESAPIQLATATSAIDSRLHNELGTPLARIPSSTRKMGSKPRHNTATTDTLRRPFVPPSQNLLDVSFFSSSPTPTSRHKPKKKQSNDLAELNIREDTTLGPQDHVHPDLAMTMEYEARKQKAMQSYKQQEKERRRLALSKNPKQTTLAIRGDEGSGMPSPPSSSPYRNRYLSAKAALQPRSDEPTNPISDTISTLSPSDPRTYLINTSRIETHGVPLSKKSSRTHGTTLLPFETTEKVDMIHQLRLSLSTSIDQMDDHVRESYGIDDYITTGKDNEAFTDVDSKIISAWQARLEGLVLQTFQSPLSVIERIDLMHLSNKESIGEEYSTARSPNP